jgi:capsular exopolysaccharide synthesis family protein
MISSSEDSDGKSTIALNLAFAITQADKKVALIDGDLRSPSIHKMLDLPRQPGLSEVFRDRLNIFDVVRYWKDNKSLIIIPAGNPPPNSAELLGSKKMDQIISVLEEVVDIVIIDSPPSFIADPLILSTKVDGVLLVVTSGKTRSRSAQLTKEQFQRVGAKIIGIVINQLKPGSGLYYPKYYQSDYVLENKPSKKSLRERLFPSKKPMDNTVQPVNPK